MCTNSQKQQLHKENISLFLRPYTRMGQVVVCSTSTESMKEGNTYEWQHNTLDKIDSWQSGPTA